MFVTIISALYMMVRAIQNVLQVHYAKQWAAENLQENEQKDDNVATLKEVVIFVSSYLRNPSACLETIARQQYAGKVSVIVLDDGSPNYAELWKESYQRFADQPNWTIVHEKNQGKKAAQLAGIDSRSDEWTDDVLILFIDGDTLMADPNLVHCMAKAARSENVGAVLAQLGVSNKDCNKFTKYLAEEYKLTVLKKAAQSQHGMVLVVNVCSMWKWGDLKNVLEHYRQGPKTGDENCLTWEVLNQDKEIQTALVPTTANTEVPDEPSKWAEQQTRWMRSDSLYFWKNFRLLLARRKGYLLFDLTVETFSPLLLLSTVTDCLWQLATGSCSLFLWDLLLIQAMLLFDSVMAWKLVKTKDMSWISFTFWYGAQVGFYALIRLLSILTLKREVWITHSN